jgi:hypothetical protein
METTPPKRGFISRLFSWKTLRIGLIVIVAVVTLLVALVTEENWRGRRDWEKYKGEQESKGEHFDMDSFIPKLPPPDQNLAMTPFLAPLQDYKMVDGEAHWNDSNGLARMKDACLQGASDYQQEQPSLGNWRRGEFCDLAKWQSYYRNNKNFPSSPKPQSPAVDVLFALRKFDPIFAELRSASERPYAVFPFHYDLELNDTRFSACKRLAQLASLRATAELGAGQGEEALKDVKLCLRVSELLRQEPLLISQLVRVALIEISVQPIWEGLARHRWTDEQLQELQKALAGIQPLDDYAFFMRGERAFGNEQLEQYRAGHLPTGAKQVQEQIGPLGRFSGKAILYHNQVALNRLMDGFALPAVDAAQHRVFPKRCDTNVILSVLSTKPNPYNSMAWMSVSAYAKVPERMARVQTSVDLATVATALERYRLVHGEYPQDLSSLAPQITEKLANDVISGAPLKYHRTEDKQFILYSVGWDETDSSGEVVRKKDGSVDPDKGDWVWRYPAK